MNNEQIVPGFDDGKDDSIRIQLQRISERCLVLYLNGYIDTYNIANFSVRVEKAVAKGFIDLVFDIRQLTYISSRPIGYLAHFMKTLEQNNGGFVFINIQSNVREVFALLGFLQFFELRENIGEALNFFSGEPTPSWPHIFSCPACEKKLRASKDGKFRCSECKTIIVINSQMQVSLG